jgi:hypothetical protein
MSEIVKNTAKAITHFTTKPGSNYKVTMTFDKVEVISYSHFEKLTAVIFGGNQAFVTVNNIIVQVKDIRMIEPTDDLTKDEAIIAEKKRKDRAALEARKEELLEMKARHRVNYLDAHKGVNKWKYKDVIRDADLIKKINADFDKTYPKESKEMISYIDTN